MTRKLLTLCLAITLSACANIATPPSGPTATVTGITAGRASVPAERVYVLRTAAGRVYLTSQVLDKPLNVGDVVMMEPGNNGEMRIKGLVK